MKKSNYDIIVIGAGVAGGVFATSQPKSKKILVVERDLSEPDRIIGELMQPGGIKALEHLNLKHLLEGFGAQPIHGYKMIKDDMSYILRYSEVENDLIGMGLRNGKFLSSIRKDLEKKSNIELVQGNVTELIENNQEVRGVKYQNAAGELVEATAYLTVVCDGPMSFFRKKLSDPNKSISSYFIGIILNDLDLENPSFGHMIVGGDAPILVYPIFENSYRILIDYPGKKPPKMGAESIQKLKNTVGIILPPEMLDSFNKAIDKGDIKVMPNHTMKGQAFKNKGAVLLGDSLNMRHPVTGGGMTATFADIISLNKEIENVPLENKDSLDLAIQSYYENRGTKVECINILANALYAVFRNPELKDAVFEYLQRGGEKSSGPLSLLAGMNKDRKYLLKHFFRMALQHPLHFVTKPRKQMRLYKSAVTLIRPILKDEDRSAII
jgi:squalene monooxygenase